MEWWRALSRMIVLALLVGGAHGVAGNYPDKTIEVIVPFGEGGATDQVFRAVARQAQAYLPVGIKVINVPGEGATRGASRVKNAAADGYTLLGTHQTLAHSFLAGVTGYAHRELAPVALLTRTVNIPTTYAGHPVTAAGQLSEWVKQNPGQARVGIIPDSTAHFFWLQFLHEAGIDQRELSLVHFADSGSQVAALLAREIDFAMLDLPAAGALYDAGALRPLGVAWQHRLPALPEVLTLTEQGIELVHTSDRGLFAPPGTPPERLQRIADAFGRALMDERLSRRLEHDLGSLVVFLPGPRYVAHLDEQLNRLQSLSRGLPPQD